MFIERYAEELLLKGTVSAANIIFSMVNNFKGWRDTRRTELTGADGTPIGVSTIPNDERAANTREQMIRDFGTPDNEVKP